MLLDWELLVAARIGDLDEVKRLVEEGANINTKDELGRTPLHRAADGGHLDVVKFLVERGADIEAKDEDGRTPLSVAARECHADVVSFLLERGAEPRLPKGVCPEVKKAAREWRRRGRRRRPSKTA